MSRQRSQTPQDSIEGLGYFAEPGYAELPPLNEALNPQYFRVVSGWCGTVSWLLNPEDDRRDDHSSNPVGSEPDSQSGLCAPRSGRILEEDRSCRP